ncbi:hypothetical protein [Novipirellula galeiformis]|nr:hypothetical protein [Novipirellula galeiformis]
MSESHDGLDAKMALTDIAKNPCLFIFSELFTAVPSCETIFATHFTSLAIFEEELSDDV